MQRVTIDIDDKYSDLVVDFLSNLKSSVVKKITIEPLNSRSKKDNVKRFEELHSKSNNKKVLTKEIAIDTNEMINDGLLWY